MIKKDKFIEFCDRTVEWCFYALLIVITFSTSLVEIASSVMIIAGLLKIALERKWRSLDSIPARFLLGVLCWTVLSCINSEYAKESFRGVLKVLQYSWVFLIGATMLNKEKTVKRAVISLATGAVMVCINGFVQYFRGEGLIRHRRLINLDSLHRISSSFIHPNDFGVYLLVIAIIFIALLMAKNETIKRKLSFTALCALSMLSLVLTKSRGAWLSFSAALLSLGALKSGRMAAVFMVTLLVIFMILPRAARDRIIDLADFKSGTSWERIMLWEGTINMIKERPILGMGVNTYSRNFPKYKPSDYPDVRYSHNCYLHMASEIGIPGALLFIMFLISLFRAFFRGIRRMGQGLRRDLSIGLFAALVGFALNCIVDTHLYSVNLAVFFYLLLGFCFALTKGAEENGQ